MIICVESAYGDKLLGGKSLSLPVLKSVVEDILKTHSETEFTAEFCARLGYKELPYSDGYSAFRIDLDTHWVYAPYYTFPRELDGAKVLYYTDRGTFPPVYFSGGEMAHKIYYLAICKYENDEAYYLFHCDESLKVVADNCFQSVDTCKQYMGDTEWHAYKER